MTVKMTSHFTHNIVYNNILLEIGSEKYINELTHSLKTHACVNNVSKLYECPIAAGYGKLKKNKYEIIEKDIIYKKKRS